MVENSSGPTYKVVSHSADSMSGVIQEDNGTDEVRASHHHIHRWSDGNKAFIREGIENNVRWIESDATECRRISFSSNAD